MTMIKRSVTISGHATSVSLEAPFWCAIKTLARDQGVSVNELIRQIDTDKEISNLSSALRLFAFEAAKAGQLTILEDTV